MNIKIPELCLVVLIGTSGSGKSTFARKHFKSTEILSSDYCRGLVSDDENDQAATPDAFEVLGFIASKRLRAGKLTVVDATNVQPDSRKPLVALAREYHCIPVAIVLNLPERICQDRNKNRADRTFGNHVIHQQNDQLRRSLRGLEREGFRHVFVLTSEEEIAGVTIERQPLWNNRKYEHGPFDIIGDIHGCFDELEQLLTKMDYQITRTGKTGRDDQFEVIPPDGRKAVFLGDLVDRGPGTPDVLKLVMSMVANGSALCVPGNHDIKLMRKLKGKDVKITHGLAESLEQLEKETPQFRRDTADFLDGLVSHYVLDDGNLVVAHAGMKESYQGRGSGKVRDFALFGETTGETDEYGLPIRYNWASEYRGRAHVVYGHTPVPHPEWTNRTINIDTGCVFGGKLTALRYPEKEFVQVAANREYYAPAKPLMAIESLTASMSLMGTEPLKTNATEPLAETSVASDASAESELFSTEGKQTQTVDIQRMDDLLNITDVTGKRIIQTSLHGNVTIREENSVSALEVMSRFAANPNWLIYLPPTMSPSDTSSQKDLLEHPEDAIVYYQKHGVQQLICEEKHMGSRAVVIVCRNSHSANKRFKVTDGNIGICHTRTGRSFFQDVSLEGEFLEHICRVLTDTNFWERFKTDWVILDCELMPWSAKAQELLKDQYAAVGIASEVGLSASISALKLGKTAGRNCDELLARHEERLQLARQFVDSYRRYCWPVNSLNDLKLAPFHLLATEGAVHTDKSHTWHMNELSKLTETGSSLLLATRHKYVDSTNTESINAGIEWWYELTANGGEGMVVKPLDFIAKDSRGLLQPAIKCRGREYLRIIYGPEYTLAKNLDRLRRRKLATKRSLALREFALGVESLERFVKHEPLYRVHECVFGVLALESEPVDPRL
jgi:protein phosphatase